MTAPLRFSTALPLSHFWPEGKRTPLQNRTCNALHRGGIRTIGHLLIATPGELLDLYGFGGQCLAEVRLTLGANGLSLTDDGGAR